jgi:hypothetical protein
MTRMMLRAPAISVAQVLAQTAAAHHASARRHQLETESEEVEMGYPTSRWSTPQR